MYSAATDLNSIKGVYPERDEPDLSKTERTAAAVEGFFAPWLRPRVKRFRGIIRATDAHAGDIAAKSDKEILETSRMLRQRLRREGFTQELAGWTFALVREAADRVLGQRHFDVQLLGGWILLQGMVAEMETGEGKTLTATLPACTAALAGVPVHIVTVNDYLAKRDSEWMRPIYSALGIKVGHIVHGMDPAAKRESYRCDITYCTNKELAFDYLRDRIVLWDRPTPVRLKLEKLYGETSRVHQLLMRGLHFAIVDEADSVLIDEARTPLIISAEGDRSYGPEVYRCAIDFARELDPKKDFMVAPNERKVELSARGESRTRELNWAEVGLQASEEQRQELIRQALVALHLFDKDKHYLIKDGKIQIIDEYTGRLMPDRSWERGIHQLIEIKEDCPVTRHKETRARISYQRFFRRYLRIAGMTGTAREVAGELWTIYRLRVVTVPPNRPIRRKKIPDRIYRTAQQKWDAVVRTVAEMHQIGRPILVGTRSVEASEHLSGLLADQNLTHRVLNARQDKEEAEIISQAGELGRITVATNMAGRGTDIKLGRDVADMGGLHVIATECHEARRIDRQLFGRCGRQGDPGSFESVVSFEDELITVYVGKWAQFLANLILRRPRGGMTRLFGKNLFHSAQRSAEQMHAQMRGNLLRMDEQLGESLAFAGRPE